MNQFSIDFREVNPLNHLSQKMIKNFSLIGVFFSNKKCDIKHVFE